MFMNDDYEKDLNSTEEMKIEKMMNSLSSLGFVDKNGSINYSAIQKKNNEFLESYTLLLDRNMKLNQILFKIDVILSILLTFALIWLLIVGCPTYILIGTVVFNTAFIIDAMALNRTKKLIEEQKFASDNIKQKNTLKGVKDACDNMANN